ncbi:MAG: hypothetical protein J1F01_04305 [Oscillospiraceae bacterium]|nr:hypothetical protein [Oscillospiraceae bacterium]
MGFDGDRIAYLQMIESIIDRMSNKSGNIKGFAVTIVAGVTALSFKEASPYVLILSFLTVLIFLWLDLYYLGMERKYKFFYKQVCQGRDVDFNLSLDLKESELREAKATKWQCLTSKSIYYFYIPLGLLMIIILILKFKGVI